MIAFIKGKIFSIGLDHIIIESNNMGYNVYFSNQEKLVLNQETVIYTYQHVREDEISLFGFIDQDTKVFFTKLITVKGVGPKTAMNILKVSNIDKLSKAIEDNDLAYIKSLPGIGAKSASQIILDLKGKLVINNELNNTISSDCNDAIEGLKSLGYKASEVNFLLKVFNDNPKASVNEYIKYGLQLLNEKKRSK